MHNVTTLARIASTIELRTLNALNPDGAQASESRKVATFLVASDRPYKTRDGKYTTDFIRAKAWNGLAETIAKYFQKGDKIMLFGYLESSQYTQKADEKCPKCSTELEISSDKRAFDIRITGFEFVEAATKRNESNVRVKNTDATNNSPVEAVNEEIIGDESPWA